MDFQKIVDYLADDWYRFVDRAKRGYEEAVDIGLDQWHTMKNLDNRIKAGIGGGILVIILIVLIIAFRSEPVPIWGTLETSEVIEGSFISVANESEETIQNVILILDDNYIYKMEELTPLREATIFLRNFHYLVGEMEEGEPIKDEGYVPYNLKVVCPLGEKEIELTKKKRGWFW